MALIKLSNELLAATINCDSGGRITSFTFDGDELLVSETRDAYDWGLYPMVPYAGRVRDATFSFKNHNYSLPAVTNGHALHGTTIHQSWTPDVITASHTSLSVDLGKDWPFRGRCTHTITLQPHSLRCVLTIHAEESMPVQVGWHPWFHTPLAVHTDFNAMLMRDAMGITTSQRTTPLDPPVDDCFLEPNSWPRVSFARTTVEIASDCPFWVRFDARTSDVCIEPQSGPPNGINSAPLVLNAGQSFSRWMELRIL